MTFSPARASLCLLGLLTACGRDEPAPAPEVPTQTEPSLAPPPAPSATPSESDAPWPQTPLTPYADRLAALVVGAMREGRLPAHDFVLAARDEGDEGQDVSFRGDARPEGALRPIAVMLPTRATLRDVSDARMLVSMGIWLTRDGLFLDLLEVGRDLGVAPTPPSPPGLAERGADEVIRRLRAGELDGMLLSPARAREIGLGRFDTTFAGVLARREELEAVQARVRAAPAVAPEGYLFGVAAVFAEDARGDLFRGTIGFTIEDEQWVVRSTPNVVIAMRMPAPP